VLIHCITAVAAVEALRSRKPTVILISLLWIPLWCYSSTDLRAKLPDHTALSTVSKETQKKLKRMAGNESQKRRVTDMSHESTDLINTGISFSPESNL